MAAHDEFIIENALAIRGPNMQARVIVPASHFKVVDDCTYIHVSTVPAFSSVLFGGTARNNTVANKDRPMSHTDVIQQLYTARNKKIDAFLSDLQSKSGPAIGLEAFGKTTARTGRVKRAERAQIPASMEIDTLSIGDVQGISNMRVLTGHKTCPLYMECTSANLNYVRGACMSQIKSGDIKRHRDPKTNFTSRRRRRKSQTTMIDEEVERPTLALDEEVERPIVVTTDSPIFAAAEPPIIAAVDPSSQTAEDTSSTASSCDTPEKRCKSVNSTITQFFKVRGK